MKRRRADARRRAGVISAPARDLFCFASGHLGALRRVDGAPGRLLGVGAAQRPTADHEAEATASENGQGQGGRDHPDEPVDVQAEGPVGVDECRADAGQRAEPEPPLRSNAVAL